MIFIKHGTKPTYSQRKTIQDFGLDPRDWLVTKDTSTEMVLVYRYNEKTVRSIPKGVNT